MKAIKYLMLITILPLCIATADERAREHEEWTRKALARERERAEEVMKNHSETKRFEERYGAAKEKHPEHFAAMMNANKKAAESWNAVLRKAEEATNPDSLSEVKQIANAATADAYLAEMTLKYAAAATERKNMVDTSRDRDVGALAAKMDANERALLLANRAKNEAQAAAEKLQNENRILSNELRAAFDKAREKNKGKDKDRDRDRDREKERENDKDNGEDKPEGGGVLGR